MTIFLCSINSRKCSCISSVCQCVVGMDGLFENPQDCNSFCSCNDGLGEIMNCSDNLHFSMMREACVDPEEANCELPGKEVFSLSYPIIYKWRNIMMLYHKSMTYRYVSELQCPEARLKRSFLVFIMVNSKLLSLNCGHNYSKV